MFGQFFENRKLEKRQKASGPSERKIYKTQPEIQGSSAAPKKNYSIAKLEHAPWPVFSSESLRLLQPYSHAGSRKLFVIPDEGRFNQLNSSGRSKSSKKDMPMQNRQSISKFEPLSFGQVSVSGLKNRAPPQKEKQVDQLGGRTTMHRRLPSRLEKHVTALALSRSAYSNIRESNDGAFVRSERLHREVAEGGRLEALGNRMWGALHTACFSRNLALVKYLVENGYDLDDNTEEGLTPLMVSAQQGDVLISEVLINAGCNVNQVDSQRNTFLHHALQCRQYAYFGHFLSHPKVDLTVSNLRGETVLKMCRNKDVKKQIVIELNKRKSKHSVVPNLANGPLSKQFTKVFEILDQI